LRNTPLQFGGLGAQLFVTERGHLRLQRVDGADRMHVFLDEPIVTAAKNLL
jgi:hypothetical protein